MNLDILQLEVERLEQLAEEAAVRGLAGRVQSCQAAINILRCRLDKLEMIKHWEADDEYNY